MLFMENKQMKLQYSIKIPIYSISSVFSKIFQKSFA